MLVEAYGDAALSVRSCREWFQKFQSLRTVNLTSKTKNDKEWKAENVRRRGIESIIG